MPDRTHTLTASARRPRRGALARSVGALLPAVAALTTACASADNGTGVMPPPEAGSPCAGGASVQLGPLQGARLDCSTGTTVTLPGGGATYLVVPNLAVGDVANRSTAYTIGATGVGVTTARVPAPRPPIAADLAPGATEFSGPVGPGAAQRRFDAELRALPLHRSAAPAGAATVRADVQASPPPTLGSIREFHVISTLSSTSVSFKAVEARLAYIGTNILIYEDTLAPPGGFTQTQFSEFGKTFDQVLYPIDVNAFGPPSDTDANARLIMLLTPVVNGLTSSSSCASQGYVAGFFTGNDLVNSDTTSNQGEIFYALVPDPSATVSCTHTVDDVTSGLGPTFLHEVQHMINFSQHVLVHHGSAEDGWLDEGLSLMAEELGARYYEDRFPPPSGRSNPDQIFPDSAEAFIGKLLVTSYDYLLSPDTTSTTLHTDDQIGLAWRAGDWLLLHWLGDRNGGAPFYHALEETSRTGIANIEAAAGQPFTTLFGDFGAALYTDSLPGVARTDIPPEFRFTTRNLRQLYGRLFAIAGPSASVPYEFPILPRPLPATGTISASLVPGSMDYYTVNSATSADSVVITFSAPGGAPLSASVKPQLTVFRLP